MLSDPIETTHVTVADAVALSPSAASNALASTVTSTERHSTSWVVNVADADLVPEATAAP